MSPHGAPGRLVAGVGIVALAATIALATFAQDPTVSEPALDDPPVNDRADRTSNRALIEKVREVDGGYDDPSAARRISGPNPIQRGPVLRKPLLGDTQARARSLEQRAAWRAYVGAPPVMPHSRNFTRTKTCLDCHAKGIRLGDRFGSPVSHPHFVNCTQCHVESNNLDLPPAPPVENAFRGTKEPGGGQRNAPGAPPVVPHATLMRSDCLSCHGPESYLGMAIDHPERTNCTQCHGVAASLDQTSPFFTGRASLVVPRSTIVGDDAE